MDRRKPRPSVGRIFMFLLSISHTLTVVSQSAYEKYLQFKNSATSEYSGYREEANERYGEWLREAWMLFDGQEGLRRPEDVPRPPMPFDGRGARVEVEPVVVKPIESEPQPMPVEPIREVPVMDMPKIEFDFYGLRPKMRFPKDGFVKLKGLSPEGLAEGWEALSNMEELDNTIRDCLEARLRYRLSDWAFLQLIEPFAREGMSDTNDATLLTAWLLAQTGYAVRLGIDGERLVVLFGTRHKIYERIYYPIDGLNFYPIGGGSERLKISTAHYEGERPISLFINESQNLGDELTEPRELVSRELRAQSRVAKGMIAFAEDYPRSILGDDVLSSWAVYAKTPLSDATKNILYPPLRQAIEGKEKRDAVGLILNWVQTAFVYEYDDKVWGGDRPFFAEETLFYPYCDCEDRAILFSRLVRDLTGLDVALVYYPGHLAAAVDLGADRGEDDVIVVGDRRFVVCDPTYIGAPVGVQMPGLDYGSSRAMVIV